MWCPAGWCLPRQHEGVPGRGRAARAWQRARCAVDGRVWRALWLLCGHDLQPVVEMVLWARAGVPQRQAMQIQAMRKIR